MKNPAEHLKDKVINDEWIIGNPINKPPGATGGRFSIGYEVEHKKTKEKAFLKAIDMSSALHSQDPPRELEKLLKAYNFERDLLLKCSSKRMRRVLVPICDGSINVFGSPDPSNSAYYILFKMADGDIRKAKSQMATLDVAWSMRSLHHTCVGIKELHSTGIAHQDLKPSNVIQFDKGNFKISDLGRAHDKDTTSPHDTYPVPGDQTYAPPESFYGIPMDNFGKRRLYDLYTVGGLIFFHFMRQSPTSLIIDRIIQRSLPFSNMNYDNDMPSLQTAFADVLVELKSSIPIADGNIVESIVHIAKELCNPDYSLRGDPEQAKSINSDKYSMERYISRFNYLAKRCEGLLI